MKFDMKRSAGLKGAAAVLFFALAGGGAFAFARKDARAASPAEPAPVGSGVVATAPAAPSAGKPAEKAPSASAAPCGLPEGEDRATLLSLRRLAKSRKPTAESAAAQARLDAIAKSALAAAESARGDDAAERSALTKAFFATLDREGKNPIRARLDELSQRLFFGGKPTDDIYTVKSGDRLITIARAQKTTWSFIKRVNKLKTDSIRVGQKLRIPRGTMELAVFKTDFLLVATQDGLYVKAWDVGTGREDRTPESSFKITERIEQPTWYAPDGKVYPFGEKENILGTRWLGFERTAEFSGFGIHGTAFPETIGTESSAGCIRMRNEDVEEVYDLIPEGAVVTIVR